MSETSFNNSPHFASQRQDNGQLMMQDQEELDALPNVNQTLDVEEAAGRIELEIIESQISPIGMRTSSEPRINDSNNQIVSMSFARQDNTLNQIDMTL